MEQMSLLARRRRIIKVLRERHGMVAKCHASISLRAAENCNVYYRSDDGQWNFLGRLDFIEREEDLK